MTTLNEDPLRRAQEMASSAPPTATREDTSSPLESILTIEFETAALPSAVTNFQSFLKLMQERLGVRLDRDIRAMTDKMDDMSRLSIEELDERIPITIGLLNGRLKRDKKGETQFILIHFIQIAGGGDVIRAAVFGDSDDAELAVAKTYECIWEAAGQTKPWSDGKQSIHSKGSITSTLEELDCSFDRLFSPSVAIFLDGLTDSRKGPGVRMGVRPLHRSTGEVMEINPHVAVRFRKLEFAVHVIDLDSGRVWECPLTISPKMKTTKDKGTYNVTSELPLDGHQALVKSLRSALAKAKGT